MSKYVQKKRMKILEFIHRVHKESGIFPSIREICDYMGFKSTNTAAYHLEKLKEDGYLDRSAHQARAFTLHGGQPANSEEGIPLVGRVAAGAPILAAENLENYINVDSLFNVKRQGTFALRVKGDSMIDAGIFDGDIVMVRSGMHIANGEIAVIVIDNEATVKCLYDDGLNWRLMPKNETMKPIIISKRRKDVHVAGKVIGVIRQIK